MAFKILCIDHVGIAVASLESVKAAMANLGLKPTSGDEIVADQKVKVSFFKLGETEMEFLESTQPDGPIAKFIDKNNGHNGFQHMALRVDNIDNALADLQAAGVRVIDKAPRYGAGGCRIGFLHPKATDGILLELTQRQK